MFIGSELPSNESLRGSSQKFDASFDSWVVLAVRTLKVDARRRKEASSFTGCRLGHWDGTLKRFRPVERLLGRTPIAMGYFIS